MTWAIFPIDGGLDLITPAQAVQQGRLLDGENFEIARVRGLSRIDGYERYDGGASPSVASAQLALGLQTSWPPAGMAVGDICHIIGGTGYPNIYGTVVSFSNTNPYPVVYIKLNTPLPYPISILTSGTPGFAFFDDTAGNLFNITSATGGFSSTGLAAPTGLLLAAFPSAGFGLQSIFTPGVTYYYVVTALNTNGETVPSVEASITIPNTPTTTTNGAITHETFGGQGWVVPVTSSAGFTLNQSVYLSDGTNIIKSWVTQIGAGVIHVQGVTASSAPWVVITGNPAAMTVGTNVIINSTVTFFWNDVANVANVPPLTGFNIYGRTTNSEGLIGSSLGQLSSNAPYFRDFGATTPGVSFPTTDSSGSVATYLPSLVSYYNAIRPTIQPVPGQGSVNGLFWLKDRLYATRDYYAINFSAGSLEPQCGDTIFLGASFGASTWSAQVAKVSLSSGSFADSGDAAGVLMVYNVTGTYAAGTLKNHTQADTSFATGGTAGAGSATSLGAGLYVAIGGRGNSLTTQSWQWCDLGWTLSYKSCLNDFVDMNVALTLDGVQQQYVTTQFKTATSFTGASNWNVGAGFVVANIAAAGDGLYDGWQFYTGSQKQKSSLVTLGGFGFSATDIPVTAAITGIEIKTTTGAVGHKGFYRVNIFFTGGGPTTPVVGNVIFQGTTFGTATWTGTITSITLTSGSFAGSNAVGSFTVNSYTGTFTPVALKNHSQADVTFATGTGLNAAVAPVEHTMQLVGVASGPKPNLASSAPYNVIDQSGSLTYPIYGSYLWNTKSFGAPTTMVNQPTDMLGYTGITQADIVGTNFGVAFDYWLNDPTATNQELQVGVDYLAIRFSYLPQTNGIYFWNNLATTPTAVRAQVVMHYQQSGSLSGGNAAGTMYLHFIAANGTVGGTPSRLIGADEQIRTMPPSGVTPDGGVADGSTLLSLTSSTATMNVMDWSALLTGAPQPDGSTAPASKYQSATKNFYASSGLEAIYAVSGAGPAFYFDGIKYDSNGNLVPGNFARILTGLPLRFECPRSICAHQGHIVLGYYHGVTQWSNAENVLSFDPTLYDKTADNAGVGEPVTCLASANGDALIIGTRSSIYMLQGNLNSPSTVYQSTISPTSGMVEYSLQPMANYTYIDFRGVTMVGATQKYGDFEVGHVSSAVSSWIIPRVQSSAFFESANTGYINSYLCRNKNQYRTTYADGRCLSMTFLVDGDPPQFTIQYLLKADGVTPFTLDVVQAFTERLGRDRMFAATNDGTGYVYEMDRGATFDGAVIPAWAILVPDTANMAYQNKEFKGVNLYGQAQDYATFTVSRASEYALPTKATGLNQITGTMGNLSSKVTGKSKSFTAALSSAIQLEATALGIRFDSLDDPTKPTPAYTLQAMAYDIEPLDTENQ